jgi:hypothetical protein
MNPNPISNRENTTFIINGFSIILKNKLENGFFKEDTINDGKYIGNLNIEDFEIIPIKTVGGQRKDLMNMSLYELSSYFINLQNIREIPNYFINGNPFQLLIDPCEYHSNKSKKFKNFNFNKENIQIHKSRTNNLGHRESNGIPIQDLYTWIGQNNSGKEREIINLYYILLPDYPNMFTKKELYQKYDYLNNIRFRFTQLYEGVSHEML